jgi:hypothetical protein
MKVNATSFNQQVDQAFYEDARKENGGQLPTSLQDASGNPRKLTMSPSDRVYRQKWMAIAAQTRKSRAIPGKAVKSSCVPCAAKAAGAKIPAIVWRAKGGMK